MSGNLTFIALMPFLLSLLYLIVAVLLNGFEIETLATTKSAICIVIAAFVWIFVCAVYHVLSKE